MLPAEAITALTLNAAAALGRSERIARPGNYFTRELPGRLASIVVTRALDGTVRAFHNVCAHRGNKVVWQEHPQEESSGSCRQFMCKYHGWRYDLEGKVAHVTNEQEFFDLDPSLLRMPPVACEEFAGFIFVNLAQDPVPLRHHLGDRILELEAYPFERMASKSRLDRTEARKPLKPPVRSRNGRLSTLAAYAEPVSGKHSGAALTTVTIISGENAS